jgi:3-methyladenine DNA glycosylase Mpg
MRFGGSGAAASTIVCGVEPGDTVLVRALELTAGLEPMQARRGTDGVRRLCASTSSGHRPCAGEAREQALGVEADYRPFLPVER